MTREEKLDWLYRLKSEIDVYMPKEWIIRMNNALDAAIKALKQEPCEDAISRQAVLDGLASIAKAKTKSDAQKSLMGRVMFFTEHLPSVKPQEPKWIPVSERLPEKHGRYLAYIVGKYDTDYRYIMTCEYFESDLWCWFPDDECASDNVVAWMPLPEPYKAESEGEG